MRYETITVVVDGALEDERDFTDYLVRDEYLRGVAEDAASDGLRTEVFVLEHGHAPTEEDCACVQHATDHRPRWSWNTEAPGRPDPREYLGDHPAAEGLVTWHCARGHTYQAPDGAGDRGEEECPECGLHGHRTAKDAEEEADEMFGRSSGPDYDSRWEEGR